MDLRYEMITERIGNTDYLVGYYCDKHNYATELYEGRYFNRCPECFHEEFRNRDITWDEPEDLGDDEPDDYFNQFSDGIFIKMAVGEY